MSGVDTLISVKGSGDVGTGLIRTIPYSEVYNDKLFQLSIVQRGEYAEVVSYKDGVDSSTTSDTIFIIEYTEK